MTMPDIIMIGGRAHSWRALCEQCRQELAAWRVAQPCQPALFALKEDHRPVAEKKAASRYREPTFLSLMNDPGQD
jgi:hypothetical protein